jgi:putative methanogen marker protein 4
MQILERFILKIKNKSANIGIGFGESESQNIKIVKAINEFLISNRSNISLFGLNNAIEQVRNSKFYDKSKKSISLIESKNPNDDLFTFLFNDKSNAIIRGALDSHNFLKEVKKQFNLSKIHRLALLETFEGFQFFFAPVGIDECNKREDKITLITQAIKIFEFLNIPPKISVLSGGRAGDIGRDSGVDNSIKDAEYIIKFFNKHQSNINISHDEILIENAIQNKSNLIIAPNGVSGNLIYRTLVHLGGGKAYGAIYLDLEKPIIDTSRVGNETELIGALILALALSK